MNKPEKNSGRQKENKDTQILYSDYNYREAKLSEVRLEIL